MTRCGALNSQQRTLRGAGAWSTGCNTSQWQLGSNKCGGGARLFEWWRTGDSRQPPGRILRWGCCTAVYAGVFFVTLFSVIYDNLSSCTVEAWSSPGSPSADLLLAPGRSAAALADQVSGTCPPGLGDCALPTCRGVHGLFKTYLLPTLPPVWMPRTHSAHTICSTDAST